jgi:predicted RNA-binding protein with PUA-like domain
MSVTSREISPMAYWLFKEEPDHYSLDQLFRDKRAVWSGVENNLALKHLRSVKKGDQVRAIRLNMFRIDFE